MDTLTLIILFAAHAVAICTVASLPFTIDDYRGPQVYLPRDD